MFVLRFDISGLMDEEGKPLMAGDDLEEILVDWCRRGVLQSLEEGREKVPNHP